MNSQKFGSTHTETKLDAIAEYLAMYTYALKKQNFELVYFDAFAGTGSIDIGPSNSDEAQADLLADVEDVGPIIDGSAKRALKVERPFDKYIFVEANRSKATELNGLRGEFPELAHRIFVRQGDANAELIAFCRNTNWRRTRAVVFLDPFGSQTGWDTVCEIARTKAIDLWYLFPSMLCVYRQISREGKLSPDKEASIKWLIGTDDWRAEWIATEKQEDLFGNVRSVSEKQVSVDEVTKYMIHRMRAEFKGGVLDSWLPLGPKGRHWYSLIFAWGNPSGKASALTTSLATHVMRRS
ncbi:MAG: three-Cys-motif partner protein TcmP [Alphaproteobacteria bacterium]|nr:three-Cys-motif partner protein TcmP [Alphaproteobacteria bacterium]